MGEKASFMGRNASEDTTSNGDEFGEGLGLFEISGAIKWFDVAKGFGFILPDVAGLGDILLHVTCLRRDGFQTALEGARVVCLVRQGDRGLRAIVGSRRSASSPWMSPPRSILLSSRRRGRMLRSSPKAASNAHW